MSQFKRMTILMVAYLYGCVGIATFGYVFEFLVDVGHMRPLDQIMASVVSAIGWPVFWLGWLVCHA